jgi:hypothetical protein
MTHAARRHAWTACALLLALCAGSTRALAQGTDTEGHPAVAGAGVFAAWNPLAGTGVFGESPRGWDYRINLPATRLSATSPQLRSSAAMVGVIEDAAHTTLQAAQHVNNAIWLFAVDAGGAMRFKVLPSRRSLTSNAVENVGSLGSDWHVVGPRGATFVKETPAAAVIGEGLGTATLVVAARTPDQRLVVTSHRIDSTNITSWPAPWVEVAPRAGLHPSVAAAFGDGVAIAWAAGAPSRVDVRLFRPASGQLGSVRTVADSGGWPNLIWDGAALNLIYIGPILQQHVWQAVAHTADLAFAAPTRIGDTVLNSQCDAMRFNRRLHVACAHLDAGRSRVWYSTSTAGTIVGPPLGPLPWEPESHTGLDDHAEPALGAVGDEIFVLGINRDGILQYARRDPHVLAYEWGNGEQPVERWLEVGSDVDPSQRVRNIPLESPQLLSFNRDLYLAGGRNVGSASDGLYVLNFARGALKGFMERLGIGFGWGEDGDSELIKAGADAIGAEGGAFFFGDMTTDGWADLVRAGVAQGGGELRVSRALPSGTALLPSDVWLPQFAHPGDVVRFGDVNGDGAVDVVRFARGPDIWHAGIAFSNGSGIAAQVAIRDHRLLLGDQDIPLLGDVNNDRRADLVLVRAGSAPAPVLVAFGLEGTRGFGTPREWLAGMAVTGDEPMLMDLDGNGTKDLVTIATGGSAPFVRAALSTGTAFGAPTQWAGAVANQCRSYLAADLNQDGREDLVCFVRELDGASGDPRSAYVFFAESGRFSLPNTWLTRYGGERQLPLIGNFVPDTKADYTHVAADGMRPILDLLTIRNDGRVSWRAAMRQFPIPSGLPWEHYRFFTEKGIGATMFPDWIWNGSPCVGRGHLFLLLGAAGSGSPDVTRLSARPGSAEGHVLEELGHSVFFNCFHAGTDHFGLHDDIFTMPIDSGGFSADTFAADCPDPAATWLDCRDPEHYFLRFMITYRTHGGLIRQTISAQTDPARKAKYRARYNWLKTRWFGNAEFYRDANAAEARRDTVGVPCLRQQCAGVGR